MGTKRSADGQGGSAVAYKLNRKEKATAIAAAKAMGLGVCGVDMIPSKRGPLVMEVNSSPGLEGIEKSTNINIAERIMEFIEKSVKLSCPSNPQKRRIKKDNIGA